MNFFSLLFITALTISSLQGQRKDNPDKIEKLYNRFEYKEITEIASGDSANKDILQKHYQIVANSYFYISDYANASKWYKKLIETDSITSADTYFRAAQSFKFLKDYETSKRYIKELEKNYDGDTRAKRFLDNPNYLSEIENNSGRYEIRNSKFNSSAVDFAPSFYKDRIVFSSSRKKYRFTNQKNSWTKQPYLDLFITQSKQESKDTLPQNFSRKLNSRLHESTTVFSDNYKTVYFTRNNYLDSKEIRDSLDVTRLKIYRANIGENGNWENVKELSFNNDNYSVAHPAITSDGTKMYFASDMPGGYGMSDLYVVDILKNGVFGIPQNLGPEINTEGRDTFPFITPDGKLYFSSDGHLGLGGLDVFVYDISNQENTVVNVGKPVNSSADDFSLIFNENSKKGYFASNRSGGNGYDDIYEFTEIKPLQVKCVSGISGVIKSKVSNQGLSEVLVKLIKEDGRVISDVKTNDQGKFNIDAVDCDSKNYTIEIDKKGFKLKKETVSLTKTLHSTVYESEFVLEKDQPETGIDLAKLLKIKSINFASGKSSITEDASNELNKIVTFLKENPEVKIEVGSHTDSRGSDSFNLNLSSRRAKETAKYLINNGIEENRVTWKGYGETVPLNSCINGRKCNQEEHAVNRRSEFIIKD